jgi:hypothetical protein
MLLLVVPDRLTVKPVGSRLVIASLMPKGFPL